VNYIGGWTFTVPKGAANAASSFKFIEFMMQPEIQLRVVEYYGQIPAFESVAFSDEYFKQNPLNEFWANEVLHGRWVPVTPGVSEMFAVMARLWDSALHKQQTPQEALDTAVAEIQAILDKNRPLREGQATS
jgi:ABC-type glycerol-3-phosphate transport system substrate-binding protein